LTFGFNVETRVRRGPTIYDTRASLRSSICVFILILVRMALRTSGAHSPNVNGRVKDVRCEASVDAYNPIHRLRRIVSVAHGAIRR